MARSSAPELKPLTSARGIAAVVVVLYHYTGGFMPAITPSRDTGLIGGAYLWVDFFFILSGFIMCHAYAARFRGGLRVHAVREFMASRVARIYPLHLAILLCFVALEVAKYLFRTFGWGVDVTAPFDSAYSPRGLLLNVVMLQTSGLQPHQTWNGPAWSIGAEFFAYLLFPFLLAFLVRAGRRGYWLMAVAAVIGLLLISGDGTDLDLTSGYGALRCLCEFGLGMIVHRLYVRMPDGAGSVRWSPAVAAATLLAMHFRAPDILVVAGLAGLVLVLALDEGWLGRALSAKALVWLGSISYSIYLCHFLLLRIVQFVARASLGHSVGHYLDAAQSVIFTACMGAVVLAAAAALHRYVEQPARSSVRRWLIGGSTRGPAPAGTKAA